VTKTYISALAGTHTEGINFHQIVQVIVLFVCWGGGEKKYGGQKKMSNLIGGGLFFQVQNKRPEKKTGEKKLRGKEKWHQAPCIRFRLLLGYKPHIMSQGIQCKILGLKGKAEEEGTVQKMKKKIGYCGNWERTEITLMRSRKKKESVRAKGGGRRGLNSEKDYYAIFPNQLMTRGGG